MACGFGQEVVQLKRNNKIEKSIDNVAEQIYNKNRRGQNL
jgi:hypothetical protein